MKSRAKVKYGKTLLVHLATLPTEKKADIDNLRPAATPLHSVACHLRVFSHFLKRALKANFPQIRQQLFPPSNCTWETKRYFPLNVWSVCLTFPPFLRSQLFRESPKCDAHAQFAVLLLHHHCAWAGSENVRRDCSNIIFFVFSCSETLFAIVPPCLASIRTFLHCRL